VRLARALALTAWDLVCLVVAVVAGCGSPLPRPVTPPPPTPQVVCVDDELVAPFLCNRVTQEGYECALCEQRSCVTTTFIYCTGDKACDDPQCAPRPLRKKAH